MKRSAKSTASASPPVTQRAITSASNVSRRKHCPGSAREEAKYGETETEFSGEGTLLHALFMRLPKSEDDEHAEARRALTADQLDALTYAEALTLRFIGQFRQMHGIPDDAAYHELHEVTLAIRDPHGNIVLPGHADYIVNWPAYSARVVVDAKFGFLEVEKAAENEQLATYGCGAQQRDAVRVCGVAIVQPRNFGPRMSSAMYDQRQLSAAEKALVKIERDTQAPDAPLNVGEHCHFCRAKAGCPAYQHAIAIVADSRELAVETLPNEKLADLKRAISLAEKIGKDVTNELRKRIEAGRMPGWKLQNTGDEREVILPIGLYDAFKAQFADNPKWTAAKYDACREMGWGKLEALVVELTGFSKNKAKEFVKELSAPFVTATPKAKRCVEE